MVKRSEVELDILGVKVIIGLPKRAAVAFQRVRNRYFPTSTNKMPSILKSQDAIKVNLLTGKNPKLTVRKNFILLREKSSPKLIAKDAAEVTSRYLESVLNENGIFSIHASGVAYKDRALLFIGDNGAGKTTTGLYSFLSDHELAFLGGNRIFLNQKLMTIGGVDSISIRASSLADEFCGFKEVKNYLEKKGRVIKFPNEKVLLAPDELRPNRGIRYPLRLAGIVYVKKFHSKPHFMKFNKHKYFEKMQLQEVIYSALSGFNEHSPLMLVGAKLPYPDMFDYDLKLERVKFANALIKKVPIYYAEGVLKDISKFSIAALKSKHVK